MGYSNLGTPPHFPRKLYPRKLQLFPGNIHLVGPPEVGKSCLIFYYLKGEWKEKKWVYIDTHHPRYVSNWKEIPRAELVIIDNYTPSIQFPLTIPTILISSPNIPTPPQFRRVEIGGLDWDEFLHFYTHLGSKKERLLGKYLTIGLLPGAVGLDLYHWEKYHFWLRDRLSPHRELLTAIFRNGGSRTSLYQLYLQLKKEIPISKDTVYGEIERLEEEGIIYPVPKWNSPNAPKKYFLYTPSFIRLSGGNSFPNILANFYYLHRLKGKEVYYREDLTFYLPDQAKGVIVTSFPNWKELYKLISRLKGVKKVEIWSYQKGEIKEEIVGKIKVSIYPLDALFVEE
ncbi:MAG: hypothetical protein C6I01_04430 [Epsilonproteobacteria bacterium]|nr:hypothetical protein [Campylobacterota bacterium]NPA88968.1 ATP-binding protein [Campylobacterota bacterium]